MHRVPQFLNVTRFVDGLNSRLFYDTDSLEVGEVEEEKSSPALRGAFPTDIRQSKRLLTLKYSPFGASLTGRTKQRAAGYVFSEIGSHSRFVQGGEYELVQLRLTHPLPLHAEESHSSTSEERGVWRLPKSAVSWLVVSKDAKILDVYRKDRIYKYRFRLRGDLTDALPDSSILGDFATLRPSKPENSAKVPYIFSK